MMTTSEARGLCRHHGLQPDGELIGCVQAFRTRASAVKYLKAQRRRSAGTAVADVLEQLRGGRREQPGSGRTEAVLSTLRR